MDLKGEVISHCMHRKHDAEFELDLSINFQQNKPALAKAYRDLGDLMMISGCSSHSECAGLQAGHDSTNIEVSDIVTVSAGIHASNSFGGLTVNLNTNFDEIRFAAGFQRSIQATPGVGASLVAYGTGDVRAVSSGQYRYDLASIKAPTSLPTTVGVVRVTSLEDPSITGAGFQFEVGTPTIEVGWGHSWDLTDLTSDEILDFVSGYDLTESNSSSGFNPNYGGDGDNHHGNDGNSGHGGGVTDNSDGGNGVNTPWGGR
ncbi:hypothetical protein LRP52_41130 [Photobacterium sp. ZSDE20]|nr:hypothetical protein [Photobacterium sp. ZSDE20]